MPSLYYHVEAPGVNILKTVQDEVVNGVLEDLGLAKSFPQAVYTMSSFMASSQYNNVKDDISLNKNRCDVEVSYVMDKTQVPWPVDTPYTTPAYGLRSSHKGNRTPVLIDEKAGILIEHRTSACALDMNFTLTFETFDETTKAFDSIKSRYEGSLISKPFDLAFSYPVSMGMFKFLVAAYEAKTDYVAPKTFLDWINDMKQTEISFDIRKSQLTQEDADMELMIRCLQLNCVAKLTMDQKEPEVIRVDELPEGYTISFNFQIQFGRPDLVMIHTPVSIDNTVLPYGLFEIITTDYHYNSGAAGIYQDLMINEFAKRQYGNYGRAAQIIRIPTYDDWFQVDRQYVFYAYRPFLIAHFTLEDTGDTVIDLKQLDDIVLHPIVQSIMKEMGSKIFDYGGLFTVGVYANDLRLGQELLSIDDDLNLTIRSNRKDKVYHLVLSETTDLKKTTIDWDPILIKYRYFFAMTIERNLQHLIDKRYFYVAYSDGFLSLIERLAQQGRLKVLLKTLVDNGEITNEIYSYTQNPSQLADYMVYTQAQRTDYQLPTGSDAVSQLVREYYTTKTSVEGRSLFVAFVEQCLIESYMTLDTVPTQYIEPNRKVFPYYSGQGGYYGFNSPLRVLSYRINTQRHAK